MWNGNIWGKLASSQFKESVTLKQYSESSVCCLWLVVVVGHPQTLMQGDIKCEKFTDYINNVWAGRVGPRQPAQSILGNLNQISYQIHQKSGHTLPLLCYVLSIDHKKTRELIMWWLPTIKPSFFCGKKTKNKHHPFWIFSSCMNHWINVMAHLKHYFCHLSEKSTWIWEENELRSLKITVRSNKWEIKATGGIVSVQGQVSSAGAGLCKLSGVTGIR